MNCKNCREQFSEDNPQIIEGIVSREDQLCSECGMSILDRAYDLEQQYGISPDLVSGLAPELLYAD